MTIFVERLNGRLARGSGGGEAGTGVRLLRRGGEGGSGIGAVRVTRHGRVLSHELLQRLRIAEANAGEGNSRDLVGEGDAVARPGGAQRLRRRRLLIRGGLRMTTTGCWTHVVVAGVDAVVAGVVTVVDGGRNERVLCFGAESGVGIDVGVGCGHHSRI